MGSPTRLRGTRGKSHTVSATCRELASPSGQVKCHLTQPRQRRCIVLVLSDIKIELKHSMGSIHIVVPDSKTWHGRALHAIGTLYPASSPCGDHSLSAAEVLINVNKSQATYCRSSKARSKDRVVIPPQNSRRRA